MPKSVNKVILVGHLGKDPEVKYTTTPENFMKYAEFMHAIGNIKTRPASWKNFFFPEIHGKNGS